MNNKKKPSKDFMMCFFDCDFIDTKTPLPDLAAKQDNIKYTDSYTIFKVEKVGTNAIKRSI